MIGGGHWAASPFEILSLLHHVQVRGGGWVVAVVSGSTGNPVLEEGRRESAQGELGEESAGTEAAGGGPRWVGGDVSVVTWGQTLWVAISRSALF